jgi:beta-xylosidase
MKYLSKTKIALLSVALSILTGNSLSAQTKQPEYTGYLFAYFEGQGEHQEHLRFALSSDAVNWHALNRNRPIVLSDTISESGGIRDPHILRGEQGEYLIVATDMHTLDPKQGWKENPGIVLLRSTDLIHWTHSKINLSKAYPKHFGDAYWVWAPQTIYDRKVGKYMVYFTLKRRDSDALITYYAYANRDFTAFESEPRVLFRAKYGSIDNDIIEGPNGTFHLFYKGNTKNAEGREVKNGIQQATSRSLRGKWTEDFNYLDAYADTQTGVEGSSVFKLNGEQKWILMYDLYGSGRYEYQTTTDLTHFTDKPLSFTKDFFPRHGSVISLTRAEMQRLQEQWGYVSTYHFESKGNPLIRHIATADPATLVENDTLWLFTGHDEDNADRGYSMHDWLLFSTTDLRHWTQHPIPLTLDAFKWPCRNMRAYAAHPIKRNGKYYWFVSTDGCGIGVAVADKITGPYHDAIGRPLLTKEDCFDSKHGWCCIDPAIFIDDDNTPYIVWGNGQCYIAKLKDNMVEIDGDIRRIHLSDEHPFEEAPWLHKRNGKYYLTYASEFPEKIAYAMADNIWGPYEAKGIISEIAGNSDTTHPAIVEFKGRWYFFSHNGGLNRNGNSRHRSVIAEPLHYNADGTIQNIPPTSKGVIR